MKKIALFLFLGFIFSCPSFAQPLLQEPLKYSSNPSASSLSESVDMSLNLYSGIQDVSFPIYTVTSGSLKMPISISYKSTGIRVKQNATDIGLGWTLNCGGVITRTIRGLPDNGSFQNFTINGHTYSGNDFDDVILDYSASEKEFDILLAGAPPTSQDCAPDLYTFNFNGYSGKFYYSDGIHLLPQQDIIIEFDQVTNTWVLTVNNGDKYFFEAVESSAIRTLSSYTAAHVVSWHLTRIANSSETSEISFEYEDTDYLQDVGFSQNVTYSYGAPGTPIIQAFEPWYGNGAPKSDVNINRVEGKQIKKIIFNNGSIEFGLNWNREDFDVDQTTQNVSGIAFITDMSIINSNNQLIKYFKLNHSYFQGGGTNFFNKRLKLDSFIETNDPSGINDPSRSRKVEFVYEGSGTIPSTRSFAVDHWGFYNGKVNSTLIPYYDEPNSVNVYNGADRSVDPSQSQLGVLKKIVYPGSGYAEFEYESNSIPPTVDYESVSVGCGDVCGACGINDVTYTISAAISTHIPSQLSYITSIPATLTGYMFQNVGNWGGGLQGKVQVFECLVDPQDPTIVDAILNPVPGVIESAPNTESELTNSGGTVNFTLLPNKYYCIRAITQKAGSYINGTLTAEIPYLKPTLVGGLRLKSKRIHDGISSLNDIITRYEYIDGETMPMPRYYTNSVTFETNGMNADIFLTPWIHLSSNPIVPLNVDNIIGYTTVKTILGQNGENGHVISVFRNFGHNDVAEGLMKWGIESDPGWRRGLLLKEETYDNNSALKQTVENTYIIDQNSKHKNVGYLIYEVGKHPTSPSTYNPNTIGYGLKFYRQHNYLYNSEFMYLKSTKKTTYLLGGTGEISNLTEYFYDNLAHYSPTRIKTTDSKGQVVWDYTKYPSDFVVDPSAQTNSAIGLKLLQSKHITNVPIEKFRKIETSNGSRTIGAEYLDFKLINIGLGSNAFLSNKFNLEINTGLLNFQNIASSITTNGIQLDNSLKVQQTYNTYDIKGNNLELTHRSGVQDAYMWDYNYEYNTCKVLNASYAEIGYSSFETNFKGRFHYNNSNVVESSNSNQFGRVPTGKKLLMLNQAPDNDVTWNPGASISGTQKYRLSFWYHLEPTVNEPNPFIDVLSMTINMSTQPGTFQNGIISDYTIGSDWQYRYFEYDIDITNGSSALPGNFISGKGAFIDEIRIYPVNAKMSTNTFTPLVGANDHCNENNKISYFEYDGLNRLKITRNQFGNILTKNEYAIQGND